MRVMEHLENEVSITGNSAICRFDSYSLLHLTSGGSGGEGGRGDGSSNKKRNIKSKRPHPTLF